MNHELIVSGAADGSSRCAMWLKFSSNNKEVTTHTLLKEAITNNVALLQAHVDKGS